MKPKLKEKLSEIPRDYLLEVIEALCEKNKQLENEIEFILSPSKVKYSQSYYNRLVKTMIDTNSWSHFPNKGVAGLRACYQKMQIFRNANNYTEALKIATAINEIIDRCRRKYNDQNQEELNEIWYKVNLLVG